jgi:hypothetical protein
MASSPAAAGDATFAFPLELLPVLHLSKDDVAAIRKDTSGVAHGRKLRLLTSAVTAACKKKDWSLAWDLLKNCQALGANDGYSAHMELLRQFAFADLARAAHAVLERMRRLGMRPSSDSYSLVMAAHARRWNKPALLRLIGEVQAGLSGASPRLRWYGRVVAGYLVADKAEEAFALIDEFRRGNTPAPWAQTRETESSFAIIGTESPLRKLEMSSADRLTPFAQRAMVGDSVLSKIAPTTDDPSPSDGDEESSLSWAGLRRKARETAASTSVPDALDEGAAIDTANAPHDGARLKALGTIQAIRLSLCSETIGDLMNAVFLELRARGSDSFADGTLVDDAVPVSELAEYVADIPLPPMLTSAERRHLERRVVSRLFEQVTSPTEGRAKPHQVELIALVQHITGCDDGPMATAVLSSPVAMATLWEAAGLGATPPGYEGVSALPSVHEEAIIREARVARMWHSQRLLETLLSCAARATADTWRGALPESLWPMGLQGVSRLFDALEHSRVAIGLSTLALVGFMSFEDYQRRGGSGLYLALRALLQAEAHGLDVAKPAEIGAIAETVLSKGVSEYGLRPFFAPTVEDLHKWWSAGGGRPASARRWVDGDASEEIPWFPAVVERVTGESEAAPRGWDVSSEWSDTSTDEGRVFPCLRSGEMTLQRIMSLREEINSERVAASKLFRHRGLPSRDESTEAGLPLARRLVRSLCSREYAEAVEAQVMSKGILQRLSRAQEWEQGGHRSHPLNELLSMEPDALVMLARLAQADERLQSKVAPASVVSAMLQGWAASVGLEAVPRSWVSHGAVPPSTLTAPLIGLSCESVASLRGAPETSRAEAERRGAAFNAWCRDNPVIGSLSKVLQRMDAQGRVSTKGSVLTLGDGVLPALQQGSAWRGEEHAVHRALRESTWSGARPASGPSIQRTTRKWIQSLRLDDRA